LVQLSITTEVLPVLEKPEILATLPSAFSPTSSNSPPPVP
jgi:hypothetical protein